MSACCPHPDASHHLIEVCQQVIHYPSEDYPCLCAGFAGNSERCDRCQHARGLHTKTRTCDECSCRREV